jgi:hypothetical protein
MDFTNLDVYIAGLEKLPFIEGVEVLQVEPIAVRERNWDALIEVRTPLGAHRLWVEQKKGTLNKAMCERVLGLLRHQPPEKWILFAPHITTALGQELAHQQINFLDEAGNCHFTLGRHYLVHIEGKKAVRTQQPGLRAKGYQVLFALAVRHELVDTPVREVGLLAGVNKTTVANVIRDLEAMGTVLRTVEGRHLNTRGLLDRWITGYTNILRPTLLTARYETVEKDPLALEERLEKALADEAIQWMWGGGAAAYRLIKHFRGEETVLHVDRLPNDLPKRLKLLPKKDGRLMLIRAPAPIAFQVEPLPHVAPPLLIYAELLIQGGDRAREAADLVREHHLEGLD